MAFPFFSQQDVITHHSLQDHKTQICQAVAPCIKMFAYWLAQVLVPDVASMLAKPSLSTVFAGPYILHHAPLASDAIDDPLCLTIELSLDVNNDPSGSGFHHSNFQDKKTHWTASSILVAFMHSIQNSSFSDRDWSGDPCSIIEKISQTELYYLSFINR